MTVPRPDGHAFPSPKGDSVARSRGQHHLEEQSGASYTQGALALTYSLPSGLDCQPKSSALTLVQPSGVSRSTSQSATAVWAARFLQAVVEVVSSDRPLTQLVRWTDQTVYAEIAERQQRVVARPQSATGRAARAHVVTVHVCHPTPDSAEVAARVSMGRRSRAIAARLDLRRNQWVCTAIQFG